MKLVLSTVLLLGGLALGAKEVTFKFDIFSSGPDIYPCNVGLKHEKHGGKVFHTVGDSTIATNDHGSTTSGDQLPDYFKVDYGSWDGWDYDLITSNAKVLGSYTNRYAVLFGNGDITQFNSSFGKMIDKLSFNLGSERYGADFFVDVCYRRPDFDYDGMSGINFTAYAWASLTDHVGDAYSYTALAGLKVNSEIYCSTGDDEQGSYYHQGSNGAMSSSFQSTLNNLRISGVPNRCIVRFNFSETNYDNERRYQKHGAAVKVKAEISEPAL